MKLLPQDKVLTTIQIEKYEWIHEFNKKWGKKKIKRKRQTDICLRSQRNLIRCRVQKSIRFPNGSEAKEAQL